MASRGFSLVELVTAISIVSVMSLISIQPLLTWKKNAEIRGSAAQLITSLQLARSYALKYREYVVTEIDESGYRIFVDNGEGGGIFGDWKRSGGEKLLCNKKHPSTVVSTSNFTSKRFRFKGFGRNQPGTISLSRNNGATIKVIVNVFGRVRAEFD